MTQHTSCSSCLVQESLVQFVYAAMSLYMHASAWPGLRLLVCYLILVVVVSALPHTAHIWQTGMVAHEDPKAQVYSPNGSPDMVGMPCFCAEERGTLLRLVSCFWLRSSSAADNSSCQEAGYAKAEPKTQEATAKHVLLLLLLLLLWLLFLLLQPLWLPHPSQPNQLQWMVA